MLAGLFVKGAFGDFFKTDLCDNITSIMKKLYILMLIFSTLILPAHAQSSAPAWTLEQLDGTELSLSDIRSDNILLVFTGIGCSHCHEAIPFLNLLSETCKASSLEIIAVESWGRWRKTRAKYVKKNSVKFHFLGGNRAYTSSLMKKYKLSGGVPAFVVLGPSRQIIRRFVGYSRGVTDREIVELLDSLGVTPK